MMPFSFSRWYSLRQSDINWLLAKGVTTHALVHPVGIQLAIGARAADGRFEEASEGDAWLRFEEEEDEVFWHPQTGAFATSDGRAFALGEDAICNAGTYAFDCCLTLFTSPLDWLRAKRDGCVVFDWSRAFDRLRDCPRIAVPEELLPDYRQHMKPSQMPELFVIPRRKQPHDGSRPHSGR